MKICVPIQEDKGIQSEISPHFGSAAFFLIVDTESRSCRTVANQNQHHEHGTCQPAQSIADEVIDGVLVGGIGRGALAKLQSAGIQVYLSESRTVVDALVEHKATGFHAAQLEECCGGHGGSGHDCSSK